MNKQEITKWFTDKLNSCYPAAYDKDDSNIFWIYDQNFVRKQKLCKLNNQEIILTNNVKGTCLFIQNTDMNFINFDYTNIWKFFEENYVNDYYIIQSLLQNIMKEYIKLDINKHSIYYSWKLRYNTDELKAYTSFIREPNMTYHKKPLKMYSKHYDI